MMLEQLDLQLPPCRAHGPLTVDRLRFLLTYHPDTGEFTRNVSKSQSAAGRVAGMKDALGYVRIGIDEKKYRAHRLAWFYVYGKWPKEIDHINGERADNRWVNLREATRHQNMGNTKPYRNNKSGFKGVYWHRLAGRWTAQIGVHHLGLFDTVEAAVAARIAASEKYFGEFARAT